MQVYSRSGWLHQIFLSCVCIIYSHTDNREREKVKKTGAAHRSSLVGADRLKQLKPTLPAVCVCFIFHLRYYCNWHRVRVVSVFVKCFGHD